jgi:hypothetical protein
MAALIPVFFAAILVFSTKTMAKELRPDAQPEQTTIQEEETLLTVGQGVSQELLDEYKAIESKYYEVKKTSDDVENIKWKDFSILENDLNRLYVIYIQMNEEQRREQYLYLIGPLNASKYKGSPKRLPHEIEWENIKNVEIIWLDGERVEYAALSSYAREDIYFCNTSLSDDETTWAVLWTEKGYEAYIKLYGKQVTETKLLEIKPKIHFTTEINKDGTITISTKA